MSVVATGRPGTKPVRRVGIGAMVSMQAGSLSEGQSQPHFQALRPQLPPQLAETAGPAIEGLFTWYARALLRLSEFAQVVGVSEDTARDWANGHLIPTLKLGRFTYVPTQQFLKWVEDNTLYPLPSKSTRVHNGALEPAFYTLPRTARAQRNHKTTTGR